MCTPEQHQELERRLNDLAAEVASLKSEVALLRSWTAAWPAERERAAIRELLKAEIDIFRQAAEESLTQLADRLHGEISTLSGGMTQGAQAAIEALTEQVRGIAAMVDSVGDVGTKMTLAVELHAKGLENQKAIMARMETLAAAQDQAGAFNAGIERLIETYRDVWAEQKAEADAERATKEQRDVEEKAKRMAREARTRAREARLYKLATAASVPLVTWAVTAPFGVLLALGKIVPTAALITAAVVMSVACLGWAVYWLVFRQPPIESVGPPERATDTPPAGTV